MSARTVPSNAGPTSMSAGPCPSPHPGNPCRIRSATAPRHPLLLERPLRRPSPAESPARRRPPATSRWSTRAGSAGLPLRGGGRRAADRPGPDGPGHGDPGPALARPARARIARIRAGRPSGQPATRPAPAPRAARATLRSAHRAIRDRCRMPDPPGGGSGDRSIRDACSPPSPARSRGRCGGLIGPFVLFPLRPLAWAAALEDDGRAGRHLARDVGRLPAGPRPPPRPATGAARSTTAATSTSTPASSTACGRRLRAIVPAPRAALGARGRPRGDGERCLRGHPGARCWGSRGRSSSATARTPTTRRAAGPTGSARSWDPAGDAGRALPGRLPDRPWHRAGDGGDPAGARRPLRPHGLRQPARRLSPRWRPGPATRTA